MNYIYRVYGYHWKEGEEVLITSLDTYKEMSPKEIWEWAENTKSRYWWKKITRIVQLVEVEITKP